MPSSNYSYEKIDRNPAVGYDRYYFIKNKWRNDELG